MTYIPNKMMIQNERERSYKEFKYINWSDNGSIIHIAHATGLCCSPYSRFASKFIGQYKVVGLDFRGHGRTETPADPICLKSWEVFYKDLEAFFTYLNQPIVAIGHSLGGTVSAVLAARFPAMVSKLILIEPGLMPPMWIPFVYSAQKTGMSMRVPFVTRVTKRNRIWKNKADAVNELANKGPFKSWRKDILEDYLQAGTDNDEDGSIKLRCDPMWEGRILATAPCGIWKSISKIKVPTLVLYGAKSKTFLPSVAVKIKKAIPHAIIRKMPNAGHFIPMEQPEEAADMILRFIEEGRV
jgi:pimeloyl-ACP methyl ester carboxylesterase